MDDSIVVSQFSDADTAFAQVLADKAGAIAMAYFRKPNGLALKGDASPVTLADTEIEAMIRNAVETTFPEDGLFGEETGVTGIDRDRLWVVDPIDGTGAFATGSPLFGVLISLLKNGQPELGLIDASATGERWIARRGQGSFMNGIACRTSGRTSLVAAAIGSTSVHAYGPAERSFFQRVSQRAAITRLGGDCYAYGLVALGQLDAVIETDLKPYDFMAVVPVIEEAGGVVTDWQGLPLTIYSTGKVIAAATPELHAEILSLA